MNWFDASIDTLLIVLTLSFALGFIRMIIGPDVPNRAVAFDLTFLHGAGIVALIAIRHNAAVLLDIVIGAGVLGFLSTMLLARYMEHAQDGE